MNKKVLVISGPTGSGESTITNEIIKKYPIFQRLVTATSREPRNQEEDGVDYYFFPKEEFKEQINNGNILEHTYIQNRDTYYGTYSPDLKEKLNKGNVIVNVDHVGLKYYQKHYDAIGIFIGVESLDVIKERLKKRDSKITDGELNKRLKNAQDEIDREEKYYNYIVYNKQGKLEEAVEEVEDILRKEGYKLS